MTDHSEKRQHPRIELILKVTYDRSEDFLDDYASNASGGGIFIATVKPFQVGEVLTFSISFPGLLSPIWCRGEVRWRRPPSQAHEDKPTGIGVALIFESDEEAGRFSDLIDRLSQDVQELPADEETGESAAAFRVLLVEDNQVVRNMVRYAIQKFHRSRYRGRRTLEVEEAENGMDAWTLVQGKPFDLAIIDMYMPVMDGPELILRIRQSDQSPHVPIIAISSGGEEAQKAAHTAGADFFLDKPVMLAQLFQSMHRLLGLDPETP
jgi:uncharacterized protein (TIGR02266 family)